MTTPFDHSRHDWYPPGYGGPGQVQGSNGQARPALKTPVDTFVVHYGGAGASWLDFGDTAAELRGIEVNHARPQGKPNEYNSASDSAAETWEYSGRYQAAHAAGHNAKWGHLCLYGLEKLTDADADGLIRGIRRARAQGRLAGYLTADHAVVDHGGLPGAKTSCPGPLRTNPVWWARITAPLTAADYGPANPHPPSPLIEEDDMRPVITHWQGEDPGWLISIAYDTPTGRFVWTSIPGFAADSLIAAGVAVDGRKTPLSQQLKAATAKCVEV